MDDHYWEVDAPLVNGFFEPGQYVIACPGGIVAQVVIKTDRFDLTGFEEGNGLLWPLDANPTLWDGALVVEVDFHCVFLLADFST